MGCGLCLRTGWARTVLLKGIGEGLFEIRSCIISVYWGEETFEIVH